MQIEIFPIIITCIILSVIFLYEKHLVVNKFDEASSIALNCYTINKHQFVFSVEFFNHFLKTIFIVMRKIDIFFNLTEIFSLNSMIDVARQRP